MSSWLDQSRTLEIAGDALPTWAGESLFTVSQLKGTEKLGKLYDYRVDVATRSDPRLPVYVATGLVKVDELIGKMVTVKIAIEGSGTWMDGAMGRTPSVNIGAEIREISGLIVSAQCIDADTRRAFYRLRIRPWLWLATLNQDSRIFQNMTVVDISETILKKYSFPHDFRLTGPGFRRQYPKRDYQRMFWESDWQFLNRLWQEWGITFFFERSTLVLFDSPGGTKKHGPAYETLRYLDHNGQRIDEEHIYQFEIARALTTGAVRVTDYDYTQSRGNLSQTADDYRERTHDNIEHYAWGDYSQPLADAQGTSGTHNEADFEGRHLARVRLEARRAKSLRGRGRGNLRGLMVGHTFQLDGYPLAPGDGDYLVTSTKIDIVDNDPLTTTGESSRQYACDTRFTVQPTNTYFRTPQKAKKPRSHGEVAVVTGDKKSRIWTDEYGRVKVWFPWDREAERDLNSSCWVRTSSPWQGANYGAIYIPRVGHEVVIGYHDNDPDKPYIAGRHVNEFHEPPWPLPANRALSGWMSEDLEGRSTNSVVTDDTPGKLQVQMASDHAQSRLVLGSNTRINRSEGRGEARGEGFELATEAHGVARANKGLLITTEARDGASAPVKDMDETSQRLAQACEQHRSLAELAQIHDAQGTQVSQKEAAAKIYAQNDAIQGRPPSPDNPSPEMTHPDLLLASAAGIASSATDSTHLASVNDHMVTAGRDVSVSSGRSFIAAVRGAVSWFAERWGIKLVAAHGKVEIQAQDDEMDLEALKDINISSVDGKIVLNAEKEIWLGVGGSYIRITPSLIENGTTGQILERSPSWRKTGPNASVIPLAAFQPDYQIQYVLLRHSTQLPMIHMPYQLELPSGRIVSGITNAEGEAMRVYSPMSEPVRIRISSDHTEHQTEHWPLVGGGIDVYADHRNGNEASQ